MIRKPYFSLFLLCLPLFSLCSSGNDDPAPAPAPGKEWLDPIRVATYNIQYDNSSDQDNKWTTRRDLLRQLLQSEKFDIFGAQEPYLTQIKDIEPFLDGYTWVGENVIGDKTAQRRHYNPVFYRKDKFEVLDMGSFWYSETPSAPGSKGWDSYSPRMCNWVHFRIRANGREFYHFNSHFDHIGTTARTVELDKEDRKLVADLNLLTDKPVLYVCNVDEKSAATGNAYTEAVREAIAGERAEMLVIAAATEADIAELEDFDERQMFLEDLGLEESGVARLIKSAYKLLNLETFFTTGADETRAWTYLRGMKAPQTAGIIHTDFEKGFIRAEVIKYDDYTALGSEKACRDAGKLSIEGKEYVVEDGDIMHFLFNV